MELHRQVEIYIPDAFGSLITSLGKFRQKVSQPGRPSQQMNNFQICDLRHCLCSEISGKA